MTSGLFHFGGHIASVLRKMMSSEICIIHAKHLRPGNIQSNSDGAVNCHLLILLSHVVLASHMRVMTCMCLFLPVGAVNSEANFRQQHLRDT